MEKWPSFLPNPATNFNFNAAPNSSRTKMSSGYVRQRPKTDRTIYSANLKFELSDGGLDAFKAFLKHAINDGYDWFECPIATGGGVVEREVRIVNGKYKANYLEYMNWSVTMQVDVREIGVPGKGIGI